MKTATRRRIDAIRKHAHARRIGAIPVIDVSAWPRAERDAFLGATDDGEPGTGVRLIVVSRHPDTPDDHAPERPDAAKPEPEPEPTPEPADPLAIVWTDGRAERAITAGLVADIERDLGVPPPKKQRNWGL